VSEPFTMRCDDLAQRLTDLMEGALPPIEEAAALEHLSGCTRCEAVLADTHAVAELARMHGRIQLTDADRDRMLGGLLTQIDGLDAPASE